jgi:small subunit ribosomal protein S13
MSREFNYIVRLHGTNIDGTKMVPYALTDVKGVGVRLARAIVKQLGLDATERLGNLGDADVKKLETAIDDPASIGLPSWMLNRQKDPMTGDDLHMLASDLAAHVSIRLRPQDQGRYRPDEGNTKLERRQAPAWT